MQVVLTTWDKESPTVIHNGGYVSIHDRGEQVERRLCIIDDDGNQVILHNEQIGELWLAIKPPGK